MIRVRLKELIHDNGTSVSEISEETGINRASLAKIAENKSKMVKFDTLDKLKIFFKMDSIYELFADDDNAVITVSVHKMINDVLTFNFNVNIQLTRESEPIQDTFPVNLTMHAISQKLYMFTGNVIDPHKIQNFTSIQSMFFSLHPVIIERFFDSLSAFFLKDSAYLDGLSDNDSGGILPKHIAKSIVKNQAQLVFSIPDLGLITSLVCEHDILPSRYYEANFFPISDMSGRFPKYDFRTSPIFLELSPYILK